MIVDTQKPAFVPVQMTLETEAELRFFTNVIGNLKGTVALAFGLSSSWNSDAYAKLTAACESRGVTESTVPMSIETK